MDIGANVGLFSLFLSRAVGPNGLVVAVEPDPINSAVLRKNMAQNQCDNVIVLPFALGADTRKRILYIPPNHRANSSFVNLTGRGQPVEISVRCGKEVLRELKVSPQLVKMDVEGAEPEVFEGLGYYPDVLLLECVPQQLSAQGHDPRAFLRLLAHSGYELALVNSATGRAMVHSPDDILSLVNGTERNVLATRRNKS